MLDALLILLMPWLVGYGVASSIHWSRTLDSDEPPLVTQLTAFISYATLALVGYAREAYRYFVPAAGRVTPEGYSPVVRDFDDFFTRRMYNRVRDCWDRPVGSRAGRTIAVLERKSVDRHRTFQLTGKKIPCINVASYNYLGFAEDLPQVTEANLDALEKMGVGACNSSMEGCYTTALRQLEQETADYVGKKAAVVFAMGFGTNFSGLPAVFSPGTLVFSDSLNHASLVAGLRLCKGVTVRVYPHNNASVLDSMIRSAIIRGNPRKPGQWKRIIIVTEGIFSMEGEISDLPSLVTVKKKYKCQLYVDEAHSIGALGATGRGICEHHGVDPKDVDLLMGTYTKSFGSIGGYIASDDTRLINYVRWSSGGTVYGDALHSAALQQAATCLNILRGKDGTRIGMDKVHRLKENSLYLRSQLKKLNVQILGDDGSPVIPVMMYNPCKVAWFSRMMLEHNVAVVVVGYPATPLIGARTRLCVSASHTKEDLDHVVAAINDVAGTYLMVRYAQTLYHILRN